MIVNCQFVREEQSPGIIKCVACGRRLKHEGPMPAANCGRNVSRGLGDTVAKITSAVGLKPCGGCKQRQAWLNERFPYRTGELVAHA